MTWFKKVVSIEPCEVDPVDIQVEGEEFLLSGFVSHNSRLKGIEMMAAGTPWSSSPREEYRKLHRESGCGVLADNPKQWYQAIKRLLTDEVLRKEQAEAGRTYMQGQTYQANAWRWAQAWQRAYDIQRGVSK
jgi:glycosyltransferase involved in cell wall biosynthesis